VRRRANGRPRAGADVAAGPVSYATACGSKVGASRGAFTRHFASLRAGLCTVAPPALKNPKEGCPFTFLLVSGPLDRYSPALRAKIGVASLS